MSKYIIIAIVCLIPSQALAKKHRTVSELLDKYAATQDKFTSFIIKYENSIRVSGVAYGGRLTANNRQEFMPGELRFDGERYYSAVHRWGEGDAVTGPIPKDKAILRDKLWDGQTYSTYAMDPRTSADRDILFINKTTKPGSKKLLARIDQHELLGFFWGDYERIDSVIHHAETASVRDKTDQISGSDCYVIDAIIKGGKYTVWIDPQHGFNIAKAVVEKGEEALPYGSPGARVRSATNRLGNVRFENINGVWVPMEADTDCIRNWPKKGEFSHEKMHWKRTEVIVNPDHDALGSFLRNNVRNGARVFVIGAEGITYTWLDGKVVDEKGRVIMDCRPKKPAEKVHRSKRCGRRG
jgi:hypothetical protein